MQIFVTSSDPQQAAINLDDKRVCKMIVESAQIMSTVMHERGIEGPYKPTHIHHPCVKWAGYSKRNFQWLLEHFYYLLVEYKKRYEKRDHACDKHIKAFYRFLDGNNWILHVETPFVVADSSLKSQPSSPVLAYRRILRKKWRSKDKRPPLRYRKPFNINKYSFDHGV